MTGARFLKTVSFYGCSTDARDGGAVYIDYRNLEFLPQDATYDSNSVLNNVRPFLCHSFWGGHTFARPPVGKEKMLTILYCLAVLFPRTNEDRRRAWRSHFVFLSFFPCVLIFTPAIYQLLDKDPVNFAFFLFTDMGRSRHCARQALLT